MKLASKKQTSDRKKPYIITAIAVALIAAFGVGWWLYAQQTPKNKDDNTTITTDKENQNIVPAGDNAGTNGVTPSQKTQDQVTKSDVVPIIAGYGRSNATTLSIDGMVTGIVNDTGKCTYKLSWDGGSRQVTTNSTAGPSSTVCDTGEINIGDLNSETRVTISLGYESDTYAGTSQNNPTVKLKDIR